MEQNKSKVLTKSLSKTYQQITHAEDVYLYDSEGRRYMDFAAGLAVTNIGNGVKEVCDAIAEQLKKVTYLNGSAFTSGVREELAANIIKLAPRAWNGSSFAAAAPKRWSPWQKLPASIKLSGGTPASIKSSPDGRATTATPSSPSPSANGRRGGAATRI